VIDDPVVVLADERAEVADINLHGGPWVVRWMMEMAKKEGFEVCEKQGEEWPIEAVDETGLQGEVLRALPMARTELALRLLLEQPAAWAAFRERARSRNAEDVDAEVQAILADRSLWRQLHPPRVVIVGRPNAGKSTLANQLFAQERSITADLPGTTRDWVGELANIDGLAVWLIDTPGWRETGDQIESQAIERSREQAAAADLVIVVLDATGNLATQMAEMRSALGKQTRTVHVVNKCDLAPATSERLQMVASSGSGVEQLRREIRKFFGCADDAGGKPSLWTEEQRERLVKAKQSGELGSVFM
jgi:small GTP-binding protein